jgi:hypothetical protein
MRMISSTEHDRQEAARAAYDLYSKAMRTGRPVGPGAPVYSFYDDSRGAGVWQFFEPSDRHVVHVKPAHPQQVTRVVQSAFGPMAVPGEGWHTMLANPSLAFDVFRRTVLRPADFSYVAVFDMSSPSWMIPISEWPVGQQVTVRGDQDQETEATTSSGWFLPFLWGAGAGVFGGALWARRDAQADMGRRLLEGALRGETIYWEGRPLYAPVRSRA